MTYEEDSPNAYCEEDRYYTQQDGETLPLDTSRVEEYLNLISYLDLTNYVTYTADEEMLAQLGLDDPELVISVDYTQEDEDGNEVEFEHIDTVEYQGTTYLAFIPAELSVEEDAEVVIMQIVEEDGEEMLEAVEDDEIADAVFNILMERAEAEEDEEG